MWHPELGLLVSDGDKGGLWSLSDHGLDVCRVAHRRGMGGVALHENGDVVVSGRNVALKSLSDPESRGVVLLKDDPTRNIIAFNDLTTDSAGRVWVGSVQFQAMHDLPADPPPLGMLHRIDLDGSVTVVATGIKLTNGLGFSPDGQRLYYSDSLRRVVNVYPVSSDGALGEPQVLITCNEGFPDGLALSADGDIWLAQADANLVVRYGQDGGEKERFRFDEALITSLCFGGADLRELYVVTGSRGSSRGGCVYRLKVDATGLERSLSRVRIPAP